MAYIVENDVIVAALTKQLQTLSGNGSTFWCLIYGSIYVFLVIIALHTELWSLHDDISLIVACSMLLNVFPSTLERWVDSLLISFRDSLADDVTTSHSFLSWQNVYLYSYSFWASFFFCFFFFPLKIPLLWTHLCFSCYFDHPAHYFWWESKAPRELPPCSDTCSGLLTHLTKPHSFPAVASHSLGVPEHGQHFTVTFCCCN